MVVLLIAVVVALVVPQVLRPGVDGQAGAAPLPAPPELGSCVVLAPRSSTPIDCREPHDGEVFVTWTADDPSRPVGRHSLACTDELAAHLGSGPTTVNGWQPTVFNLSTRLIRAPRGDRVGDRAWAACLLRPANQSRYTGTVFGLPANATDRPGVFGDCSSGSLYFRLPCTHPHTIERLGTTSGLLPTADAVDLSAIGVPPALDAALHQNCQALAVDLIGRTDPTFGGRLAVDVVSSSLVPAISPSPTTVAWSVDCIVTSGDVRLDDSVVGLGANALPVG